MDGRKGEGDRVPREENDDFVSPSPWNRSRTFIGEPVEGGMISRMRWVGKSVGVGRRGGIVRWIWYPDVERERERGLLYP
jgi:hypothetical protein